MYVCEDNGNECSNVGYKLIKSVGGGEEAAFNHVPKEDYKIDEVLDFPESHAYTEEFASQSYRPSSLL